MAFALFFGRAAMFMFGSSIIGTLTYSGKDAAEQSQKLRDKIAEVNKSTKVLKEQYDKLLNDNLQLTQEIKDDIVASLDQHVALSAAIDKTNKNFNDKLKNIQIIGVVFVMVIFLLLLLKQIRILDFHLFR
jgi:hypothetical protein